MRAIVPRILVLLVLFGIYGALQPAEVEGQWPNRCWYCVSLGGFAWCETTHNEGWNWCEAVWPDTDGSHSYCNLGRWCTWVAA